jgi:hypothetical protein
MSQLDYGSRMARPERLHSSVPGRAFFRASTARTLIRASFFTEMRGRKNISGKTRLRTNYLELFFNTGKALPVANSVGSTQKANAFIEE